MQFWVHIQLDIKPKGIFQKLLYSVDTYFTYEIAPFIQRKINKASGMLTKVGPNLTTDFFIELERKKNF